MEVDLPDLAGENIEKFIKSHSKCLLFYYDATCVERPELCSQIGQMCQLLAPMFPEISFAKVNGTALGDAVAEAPYNVPRMPTLKFYIDAYPRNIPGGFVGEAIVNFLKANTVPPVTTLATKQAKQAALAHVRSAALVLYAPEAKGPLYSLFEKTARRYVASVPFFYTDSAKVASSFGLPDEGVSMAVVRPGQRPVFFDIPTNKKALLKVSVEDLSFFVETNKRCLVDELNTENLFDLAKSTTNFVALLDFNREQQAEKILATFRTVAKRFNDNTKAGFFYLPETSAALWSMFKVNAAEAPVLLGFPQEMTPTFKFPADDEHPYTADAIADWVDEVLNGKATVRVKSAIEPASNDGPVKIVTRNTFDSIIKQHDGVAVVKFFSPTCPHCTALAPVYAELGKMYENDKSVLIAEYNAGDNDLPPELADEIKGYPTLMRWDGKGAPAVTFAGARTIEKLKAFVEEGRVKGVKVEGKEDL